jgi:hypothetical protein
LKILYWNIKDFFFGKIGGPALLPGAPTAISNYIGVNNLQDLIAKIVCCTPIFPTIPFLAPPPVDLFVIVEIEEAVPGKGRAVNANYIPLMTKLVNAINNQANLDFGAAAPVYAFVPPGVVPPFGTGICSMGDETAGFIYNTHTLVPLPGGGLLLNFQGLPIPIIVNANANNSKRLPLLMNFNIIGPGAPGTISVIANHAPPTGGLGNTPGKKYKPGIVYCNRLGNCSHPSLPGGVTLSQLPSPPPALPSVFITGDFNCSINRTFTLNNLPVGPFANLYVPPPAPAGPFLRFNSILGVTTANEANNQLTSLKSSLVDDDQNGPYVKTDYLNEQYDDILFPYSAVVAPVIANSGPLDIVGKAPDIIMPGNPMRRVGQLGDRFSAYLNTFFNSISDHLPLGIQY